MQKLLFFRQSSMIGSVMIDAHDPTKKKVIYNGIPVVAKSLAVQLPKTAGNDTANAKALRTIARRLRSYGLSKPVNLTRFSDKDLQELCLVTTTLFRVV